MKRKKEEDKELLKGLEWASTTDKVYNIGLVVGGVPVSTVRRKKSPAGKGRKTRGGSKEKGK